jgi:hypothetical protein
VQRHRPRPGTRPVRTATGAGGPAPLEEVAVPVREDAGIARCGEALRRELPGEGVHVLDVLPGPTGTPATDSSDARAEHGFDRGSPAAVSAAAVAGMIARAGSNAVRGPAPGGNRRGRASPQVAPGILSTGTPRCGGRAVAALPAQGMSRTGGGVMSTTSLVATAGGIAVTTALAWWAARWTRRWRTTARLRWILAYHAGLRAELQMSYERIYTRCAEQPAWSTQKLADMEWALARVDGVLEKRRLDDLADLGRTVPSVAPPVVPVVLGGLGAAALLAAAPMGP